MTTQASRPVALVTGGNTGIGAATSRLLATRGWAVAVNFVTAAGDAHAVVAEIVAEGGQALAIEADVTDAASVASMFARCDAELGRVKGLVNCAGLVGMRGRFVDVPDAMVRQVFDVNLFGAMACIREAIPRMSTASGGSGGAIVNISSGLSTTGAPNVEIHYAMSKAALNCLTLGLSQELAGEGIRVNTVSPGATRTGMPDEAILTAAAMSIPMGRCAEPNEIAEAIAWLLSDQSSYVAGAYLRVGGGKPG